MELHKFDKDQETYKRLLGFLERIDSDFIPPLSSRDELKSFLDTVHDELIIYLEDEKEIIGILTCYFHSKKHESAYIDTLGILKEHRHKGYGRILMEECFKELRKKSISKVKVRTWSTNHASNRFYISLGFKEFHKDIDARGKGIDSIYYEKTL